MTMISYVKKKEKNLGWDVLETRAEAGRRIPHFDANVAFARSSFSQFKPNCTDQKDVGELLTSGYRLRLQNACA